MRFGLPFFLCLAPLLLSSCGRSTVDPSRGGQDLVVACSFEVRPPGSYENADGDQVPTVVPGAGGTQAGADALNACIRRKAAELGIAAMLPAIMLPAMQNALGDVKQA